MHDEVSIKRDEYVALLNQSVYTGQKFVYLLSLSAASKKDKAKELIERR